MNKLTNTLLILIFCTMIGQVFVNDKSISEIRINRANIESLQQIVEKQNALIQWQSHRLTKLERPDEPVFPPRHPGRIGSIESSPDQ